MKNTPGQFLTVAALAVLVLSLPNPGVQAAEPVVEFFGTCDASAAATIDGDRFVIASDEDDILRIYRRAGGRPELEFDISDFLGKGGSKKPLESDIEGAAQIGALTYWITSHGRNSKGREKSARHRLFATEVTGTGDQVEVKPVGHPYASLVEDLIADPRLARYRLREASQLAAEAPGGLNIEGLASTPDGHLLIGFRNPLFEGRALVVPLLNPQEVIAGQRAKLGAPAELDLGGLGVRSVSRDGERYLIIAGAIGDGGTSRLFEWKGGTAVPRPIESVSFRGLNPEAAVFPRPDGGRDYFIFSDDGGLKIDGQDCKTLSDPGRKHFRGTQFKL